MFQGTFLYISSSPGTAPYIPDIQCRTDNMIVKIDTTQLKGINVNSLKMGHCKPSVRGHYRIWKDGLSSCGSKVAQVKKCYFEVRQVRQSVVMVTVLLFTYSASLRVSVRNSLMV